VCLWQMSARAGLDHRLQSRLDRMGQAVVMLAPQAVYCERRKKSAAVNLKLDALKAQFSQQRWSDVLTHASMLGPAYVEGQALPSVAQKVEAFFTAHPRMSGLMAGLTMAHQHACIERVRAVCAEFDGVASIGVLENNACAVDLESSDHIRALLDADRRIDTKVIAVEPLLLPAMPECFADYMVEELLTPAALKQEGLDMSHCVGGYHAQVRSNVVRILRIRGNSADKRTWSTAEVTQDDARLARHKAPHGTSVPLGPRAHLKVVQHCGRFNKGPLAMNEAVLRFVVLLHGRVDLATRAELARSGTRTAKERSLTGKVAVPIS
ncbi:MAG: PcfJ domain-containing protein, partial [Burkholderiales bacterium]|nr:PcfJ domain-containing protein [Burkholderiales bacterium]